MEVKILMLNSNREFMLRYLGFGVIFFSVIRGEITLAGIEFGDNFGQEYLTGQNGIAIARTEVKYFHIFTSSQILSSGYKSVNILCLDLPYLESLDL